MDLEANVPSGPIEQKWDRRKFEMKLVNPSNRRKHSIIMVGLIYWGLLHAAHNTSYNFSGDQLKIRSGFFKSTIRLHLLRGVEKTGTITRVLGWGIKSRAFCNRFRNGVVLIFAGEKVFLSPSNPDIFIERVRSLLPELRAGASLHSGSGQ